MRICQFIAIFFINTLFFGQINIFSDYNKELAENILKENAEITDSLQLQKNHNNYKRKYTSKRNQNTIDVVYLTLLAKNINIYTNDTHPASIRYFKQSIKTAEKTGSEELLIYANYQYASYLYSHRQMAQALPIVLNSLQLLEKQDPHKLIDNSEMFKRLGFYLGTLGQPDQAIKYLEIALSLTPKNTKQYASILDNMGLYYIDLKKYKEALNTLLEAEKIARATNDSERYAKVKGNLAKYYSEIGKTDQAYRLLQEDIKISKAIKNEKNTIYALIELSRLTLKKKDYKKTEAYLNQAETYAKSNPDYQLSLYNITELQLELAKIHQHDILELNLRRKLDQLKEELSFRDGNETILETNWKAHVLQYSHQLEIQKQEQELQKLKRTASILVLALLLLLMIVLYRSQKRKLKIISQEKEQEILNLQLEISLAEKKLNDSNQSLESFKKILSKKTEQFESLSEQIKNQHQHPTQKQSLQTLMNSHLMTEENWLNFKRIFIAEQPEYYNFLKDNFPDLTDTNLRLLMLLKLGLTQKEIANTLGVTTDAIKKAKQRLRKKYDTKIDALLENLNSQETTIL